MYTFLQCFLMSLEDFLSLFSHEREARTPRISLECIHGALLNTLHFPSSPKFDHFSLPEKSKWLEVSMCKMYVSITHILLCRMRCFPGSWKWQCHQNLSGVGIFCCQRILFWKLCQDFIAFLLVSSSGHWYRPLHSSRLPEDDKSNKDSPSFSPKSSSSHRSSHWKFFRRHQLEGNLKFFLRQDSIFWQIEWKAENGRGGRRESE